jgi:hypothetical protein
MLAKKKPSKQKNTIMIVVLLICFGAMIYMLVGQNAPVEYEESMEDLLSPDFMQARKTRKIDSILDSLGMKFIDYNIYKRMKGGVSLPVVEDDDVGNDEPFQIKQFIQDSF